MGSKIYGKKAPETAPERYDKLPTDRPVAVYYRQSDPKQVGNESTAMQQEDLPTRLIEWGWPQHEIHMNTDDAGVSGTLDIDDRKGMTHLMGMIEARAIGAVAIVNEHRAFRDDIGTEASQFVRACKENEVVVVLRSAFVYRFHDPQDGAYHAERFLHPCREGAQYIEYHIKGNMLEAKRKRALRGLWTGGSIATGYMVEIETCKYIPFKPSAEVILAWFLLFLRYKGNLSRTWEHIRDHGPYLPDYNNLPDSQKPPRNADGTPRYLLKRSPKMKARDGHYYPSKSGLGAIFTNVMYIGYSTVCEWEHPKSGKPKRRLKSMEVIKGDNGAPVHEPIIDADVFWQAFNYLSPVTIDGEPNPNYTQRRATRPKNVDDPRRAAVERPFLEGILYASDERGDMQPVYTFWNGLIGRYEYTAYLWTKDAERLDEAVHQLLAEVAETEKYDDVARLLWTKAGESPDFAAERKRYQDSNKRLERERKEAKMRWEHSTLPELVEAANDEMVKIDGKIARNNAELARIDKLEADWQETAQARARIFELLADYNELGLDDKRLVRDVLIERVEGRRNGRDLELAVIFRGGSPTVKRSISGQGQWTSAQRQQLIALTNKGANNLTVAAAFPSKTWVAILRQRSVLLGSGRDTRCAVGRAETFVDYLGRLQPTEAFKVLHLIDWRNLDYKYRRVVHEIFCRVGDAVYKQGEMALDVEEMQSAITIGTSVERA